MKIWRSYGSAHSAQLSVIGKFRTAADASLAEQIVEDFVNAEYEERYPDIKAFVNVWKTKLPGVEVLGPNDREFNMGLESECDVGRSGETVTVSGISTAEIGGIIKLMLLKFPLEVKVTGRTGP